MKRAQSLKAACALALCAGALAPVGLADASAGKPVRYAGKTKEGTKVSFVLRKGHLDRFQSSVPTSCVSAQGGNPTVTIRNWGPPYMYKLGRSYKFEVKSWPTTTYSISSRRVGKAIKGKLALSYSMLANNTFGGYRILTCYGTASFRATRR